MSGEREEEKREKEERKKNAYYEGSPNTTCKDKASLNTAIRVSTTDIAVEELVAKVGRVKNEGTATTRFSLPLPILPPLHPATFHYSPSPLHTSPNASSRYFYSASSFCSTVPYSIETSTACHAQAPETGPENEPRCGGKVKRGVL